MEGREKRRPRPPLLAPLRLERFVPIRDVRKLIWHYLSPIDREVARCAQNSLRRPQLPEYTDVHWVEENLFALLKWGHAHGMALTLEAHVTATEYGRLGMLRWMRNRCVW
jgi:hypothetical protein